MANSINSNRTQAYLIESAQYHAQNTYGVERKVFSVHKDKQMRINSCLMSLSLSLRTENYYQLDFDKKTIFDILINLINHSISGLEMSFKKPLTSISQLIDNTTLSDIYRCSW